MLKVERFCEDDIPGLVALSAAVGWDYDEAELRTVLSAGEMFGQLDETGKIISSAAIISYGQGLASLGMVIVHPDHRGLGLGKMVTEKCLKAVPEETAVMLVATPEGRPMYEKMGFFETGKIIKCIADNYTPGDLNDDGIEIRRVVSDDMATILDMDRKAFGGDRRKLMESRIRQARRSVVAMNKQGKLLGFCLSVEGPVNMIIGPLVAENDQVAALLIDAVSKDYKGKFRIDLPAERNSILPFLKARGFVEAAMPPLMLNSDRPMGRDSKLYALAAQIFG
ncbi:GNAT family N-acetyltransferase [Bacillus sp. B-jedd]|uniref:GNAT family N-acetyltransferase n=1 Tax=Bacillus sp. B-jedd TaxID=1476857 RepID=UPI0005157125|nr:GNAT family N-acetyltransferase [Bacillus sp. B-jedd]CEG25585.1 acetyltransferase [Bacillus sp. B-jedd]